MNRLPLVIHTGVAQLIDQLQTARVHAFGGDVAFIRRLRAERAYWYARHPKNGRDRPERYLGPETPELLAAIEMDRALQLGADDRRTIVSSLKAAGLHAIDRRTGAILKTLAEGGVFRLRGVVVGTVAFQTYGALLGVTMPQAIAQTADLDIAQDYGVSLAIDDAVDVPLFELLKRVDPAFLPILHVPRSLASAKYGLPDGFTVDVLTTSRGDGVKRTSKLKSLRSDAIPLRFMDFLLRRTVPAVALYDAGVLINVPAPERYAVHKLLISRRRGAGNPKRPKDLSQAEALIEVLGVDDPFALREAYAEARGRGPVWAGLLDQAVTLISPAARASLG